MTDALSSFIDHLHASGIPPLKPAEIVADDKRRRYLVDGDKPGKPSGSYSLAVDGDFAFGWAMSHREGVVHKWHLKSARKATAEEKAENKRRAAEARAKRDAEALETAQRAAAKARRIWSMARPGSTGYLERKGCAANGARVWNGMLVVPMYGAAGGLVGLQFISDDGSKRFLTGSAKEGSYFAIKGGEAIVICEGFATAAAIHKATGHSVIAAFDAGNLKPVAQLMRRKYPDREILIGADSDQWTVKPVTGEPWNPGIEKAQQAAVSIGGARVVAPSVPHDDLERRTDWDDIARTDGIEAVAEAFAKQDWAPPPQDDQDWGNYEPDHGHGGPVMEPDEPSVFDVIRPLGHNEGTYYFFPRSTGQIRAFSASALGSFQTLCTMADRSFWEKHFGGGDASTRKMVEAASAALITTCNSMGIHDPSKVRGVGAWMDGDRPVYNCGDVMVWDGGSCRPSDYKSAGVYQSGPRVVTMRSDPLGNAEASALLDICKSLSWRDSQNGYIVAGWIILAMVGGALRWRPHVIVTGAKGSGKSTALNKVIKPMLAGLVIEADGGSTEPGIRRAMGISSRPVVMDEGEGETVRDRANMDAVFMLARKSSSGAVIRNADGEYRANSCFCFAAINPTLSKGADLDRNTILELVADSLPGAQERYQRLLEKIANTITPGYAERMIERTFMNLPTLLHNIEIFGSAMIGTRGSQRYGDQYGALVAGAYSLTSTRRLSLDEARDWCGRQDWSWAIEDNDKSDSERLLETIISSRLRYDHRGIAREALIGRLIERANTVDGTDTEEATLALADVGIKIDGDSLLIANSAPPLAALLRDTTWSGGWRRPLLGLPGAEINDVVRFGPVIRSRAVRIPLGLATGREVLQEIPLEDDGGQW